MPHLRLAGGSHWEGVHKLPVPWDLQAMAVQDEQHSHHSGSSSLRRRQQQQRCSHTLQPSCACDMQPERWHQGAPCSARSGLGTRRAAQRAPCPQTRPCREERRTGRERSGENPVCCPCLADKHGQHAGPLLRSSPSTLHTMRSPLCSALPFRLCPSSSHAEKQRTRPAQKEAPSQHTHLSLTQAHSSSPYRLLGTPNTCGSDQGRRAAAFKRAACATAGRRERAAPW